MDIEPWLSHQKINRVMTVPLLAILVIYAAMSVGRWLLCSSSCLQSASATAECRSPTTLAMAGSAHHWQWLVQGIHACHGVRRRGGHRGIYSGPSYLIAGGGLGFVGGL